MGQLGYITFPYIDDSFVDTNNYNECQLALQALIAEFMKAGFCVHMDKSPTLTRGRNYGENIR